MRSFAVHAHGIDGTVSVSRVTTVGTVGVCYLATHLGMTVMSAVVAHHGFWVVGTGRNLQGTKTDGFRDGGGVDTEQEIVGGHYFVIYFAV